MASSKQKILTEILKRRILVLDGAYGTMIQSNSLGEKEFRGSRFENHKCSLKGNYDIIALSQPELLESLHKAFFDAGADIIQTNTFTATAISQSDYQTDELIYEINHAAANIARKIADEYSLKFPDKPRFVAGTVGPTNRTCSISPDINNPDYRNISFDEIRSAYSTQIRGLVDGGVDLILLETIFDTLNAKAALFAFQEIREESGIDIPVWISGTITDASGRTLSGQTTEAFWISMEYIRPICVGLNCALGAEALRPFLKELSCIADTFVSIHPNAGLPDEFGNYNDSPGYMAGILKGLAEEGYLNIVGGCCGTTDVHTKSISNAISNIKPREIPTLKPYCLLSGLEPLIIKPDSLFVNIGERTNVAGSAKFTRLIRESKYEEALEVAAEQVRKGAQIIDVNMDDGMLDSKQAMQTFLNMIASEPEISRVPVMIDSSNWDVIEAGLKCLQGKGIVNSISLKDGVKEFKRKAALIRKYGAAAIVMAFDELGQAETFDRKINICERSYRILTEEIDFPSNDIIFDPNIFAVATGMEEHNDYAVAYIKAVRKIKESLPNSLVSGGVSNLSFSFRGNNTIREAMHSVFLYHAVKAGMDMGIVNAGQLAVYEEIPADLRETVEDVILNRKPDATDRLLEIAKTTRGIKKKTEEVLKWRLLPVEDRISYSLIHGQVKYINEDCDEAIKVLSNPLDVIEGPLMQAMNTVGDMFGSGKMFLPQVVKSARVMKKAVTYLQPFIENQKDSKKAVQQKKILLATVKGDVHDIGKGILGVVIGCNNYEIIDLGVMVPAEKIIETALEKNVDIIGLSGLITPSLDEMVNVAEEMNRRGLNIPLILGGATTSKTHTAVKIAPVYDGFTMHINDASRAVTAVNKIINPGNRESYFAEIKTEYAEIRENHNREKGSPDTIPFIQARKNKPNIDWSDYKPHKPKKPGITVLRDLPLNDIIPYIDWTQLFFAWKMPGRYPAVLEHDRYGVQAKVLFKDANRTLKRIAKNKQLTANAVVNLLPANSVNEDIEIYSDESRNDVSAVLHFLRSQKRKPARKYNTCLADFVAPKESGINDYLGAFVVTAGIGVDDLTVELDKEKDDYKILLIKTLAVRLAEALAEKLHEMVRKDLWGFTADEDLTMEELLREKYNGIRPAPGYPACPDHTEKRIIFDLLDAENNTGVKLTETYAMNPLASICGLYFAHPQSYYHGVGKIGKNQISDYAKRKGIPVEEAERWLQQNLNYTP
ncbi:MAG: methionine synthase [candidate division Zixibacteria bacterium]|nr:methionine synthase [candidate division Zixibacteria bacterium]